MPEWVCTMGPPGRGRRSAPTHADQLVGVEVHRWQNVSVHSMGEFCPQAQLLNQHRITMFNVTGSLHAGNELVLRACKLLCVITQLAVAALPASTHAQSWC